MIAKGNQRGGGGQLAAHLMNALDNEHVELAETRGSLAQDVAGAFNEWRADSKTTNCEKYLYSLSINPDQAQGRMTREQYFEFLDRAEKRLGLTHQPRVVVFHEKRDKDGVLRQHCHAVWSRIDTKAGRAIQLAHDRMKLRSVAQEFARDLGRKLPAGMEQDNGPERHENREKHTDLREKQQEDRTGVSKDEHAAAITEAWKRTEDGPAFVQALLAKGYMLARGDKRAYIVIDRFGEPHSLARRVDGAKMAEIKARLGVSHPLDALPSANEAKQRQAERLKSLEQAHPMAPERTDQDRRASLKAMQADRRARLQEQRCAQIDRHRIERDKLALFHRQRRDAANDSPLPRPHGIAGIVSRARGSLDDRQQHRLLERRQKAELKDYDRQMRSLTVLEARERRSLEGHIRRNSFGRFAAIAKRLEVLIDRVDAQLSSHAKGQSTNVGASLRELFTGFRKQKMEVLASPARAEFSDKAAGDHSVAEQAEAMRAAERMRQQEERQRQRPKLKPDH